jgi:hypothetical protein
MLIFLNSPKTFSYLIFEDIFLYFNNLSILSFINYFDICLFVYVFIFFLL